MPTIGPRSRHPPPRGRVRPEAQHIAKLHTSGSIGMLLEHHKVPDEQKTWVGPQKKDFTRQNIHHLRQLQLDTRRKKEECEKPAVRSSCSKYDHIPAKVTAYLGSHAHAPSPREATPEAEESGECSAHTMQDRPTSEEQRGKKNFLADNIRQAAQHSIKQATSHKGAPLCEREAPETYGWSPEGGGAHLLEGKAEPVETRGGREACQST
eukprot:Em0002g44a